MLQESREWYNFEYFRDVVMIIALRQLPLIAFRNHDICSRNGGRRQLKALGVTAVNWWSFTLLVAAFVGVIACCWAAQ